MNEAIGIYGALGVAWAIGDLLRVSKSLSALRGDDPVSVAGLSDREAERRKEFAAKAREIRDEMERFGCHSSVFPVMISLAATIYSITNGALWPYALVRRAKRGMGKGV